MYECQSFLALGRADDEGGKGKAGKINLAGSSPVISGRMVQSCRTTDSIGP